jgi:pilus assembly protein Flp/PilA
MQNLIARFVKDESGATAIEYGLIAALIAVALIAAARTVGTQIDLAFDNVAKALTGANAVKQ